MSKGGNFENLGGGVGELSDLISRPGRGKEDRGITEKLRL